MLVVPALLVYGCGSVDDIVESVDVSSEADLNKNNSEVNYQIEEIEEAVSDDYDEPKAVSDDFDEPRDDVVDVATETLVVDGNKCIGCGKCAKTAGEYFEMENGEAVVVSQYDLDNSSVQSVIDKCPVGAIKIV